MIVVKDKIKILELQEMAKKMRPNLVKAMVDVQKEIMAVDGGLHADLMEFLIDTENSDPKNVWGINLYPDESSENFIEFDSVMNIRPDLGNKSRGVESVELQNKIKEIVIKLVEK